MTPTVNDSMSASQAYAHLSPKDSIAATTGMLIWSTVSFFARSVLST